MADPSSSAPASRTNQNAQSSQPSASADAPKELSNAEKKKLAKAEKQAKRAAQKAGASSDIAEQKQSNASASKEPAQQRRDQSSSQATQNHTTPRRTSVTTTQNETKQIPSRPKAPGSSVANPSKAQKKIPFFDHLYTQPRRRGLTGVAKDVHPAIQALGLQIAHYQICGSHARCAATMLALKSVVYDYKTPHGTSLARDLSSHHLSPQLSFIKSCRPFSVSQSNAIRWLKNVIANIDPAMPEPTAKKEICKSIDTFLRERLTVADKVIANAICKHIKDGDNILTYGKSAVVTSSFLTAAAAGRKFRVTIVDSRPLLEGKSMFRTLVDHGIEATYCMVTALSDAIQGVTTCLLGAHALLGDGSLYARSGSAVVAMYAHESRVPVLVCAETIKFSERIALDSITMNELAPEDEIFDSNSSFGTRTSGQTMVLNPLYDLTPAELLTAIVTELGTVPPGSAASIQRMSGGEGEVL